MAETTAAAVYELPENPVYHEDIPKLTQDDSVDADEVVNPLIQKILENTHAVKKELASHDTSSTAHADLFGRIFPYEFPEGFNEFILREENGKWGFYARDDFLEITADVGAFGNSLSLNSSAAQLIHIDVENDVTSEITLANDRAAVLSDIVEIGAHNSAIILGDGTVRIKGAVDMTDGTIKNLPEPTEASDVATALTVYSIVDDRMPKVFTVTIPATNADTVGSVSGTFPACTASETDCIADAAPAAASWDAFYDCNFRLKSISPTGLTYTVDSNLTSPMTVYITVQNITPFSTAPEGGA